MTNNRGIALIAVLRDLVREARKHGEPEHVRIGGALFEELIDSFGSPLLIDGVPLVQAGGPSGERADAVRYWRGAMAFVPKRSDGGHGSVSPRVSLPQEYETSPQTHPPRKGWKHGGRPARYATDRVQELVQKHRDEGRSVVKVRVDAVVWRMLCDHLGHPQSGGSIEGLFDGGRRKSKLKVDPLPTKAQAMSSTIQITTVGKVGPDSSWKTYTHALDDSDDEHDPAFQPKTRTGALRKLLEGLDWVE